MITTQDKELLAKKGITEEQIAEQLACGISLFKTGCGSFHRKGHISSRRRRTEGLSGRLGCIYKHR
jgi:hypothetical protein